MNKNEIYAIFCAAAQKVSEDGKHFPIPAVEADESAPLTRLGITPNYLEAIVDDIKKRFNNRDLSACLAINSPTRTVGQFLEGLASALWHGIPNPCIVYVDDEDSNLFIFRRHFSKYFTIKCFEDPQEALEFILKDATVALVLTDEVMPGLTGNQLCDEVHKLKPYLKFILLTGNPESQGDLLYHTIRHHRFYEFLQKPIDFSIQQSELLKLFSKILEIEV